MINTDAENKFFEVINQSINSGATNPSLNSLSENSLTEIENNLIDLPFEKRNQYIERIERRIGKASSQTNARWIIRILDIYCQKLKSIKKIYNNNYPLITEFLQNVEIKKEVEKLKEPEIEKEIDSNKTFPAKLKWNGANNQLYDVIRQLKKKDLIVNSYVEIAGFITGNFEGFEKNYSTVLKEISKEQRPTKNKRVNLDLSELPKADENDSRIKK